MVVFIRRISSHFISVLSHADSWSIPGRPERKILARAHVRGGGGEGRRRNRETERVVGVYGGASAGRVPGEGTQPMEWSK